MELPEGFEPSPPEYKTGMLAVKHYGSLVDLKGIEPSTFRLRAGCSKPIELQIRFLYISDLVCSALASVEVLQNTLDHKRAHHKSSRNPQISFRNCYKILLVSDTCVVELTGVEPATSGLQSQRSPN
jgi:hypothetical protein